MRIVSKEELESMGLGSNTPEFVSEIKAFRLANRGIKHPQKDMMKSIAMIGKKNALGAKHSKEQNIRKSIREMGNKRASGMIHTDEWRQAASIRMKGKRYGLGYKLTPKQLADRPKTRGPYSPGP